MLLGVAILAVGCSKFSMHRVDVFQGNYIEQQRLDNLQPGMTRSEVQLLLGTPLVQDVYNPYVWYYVFFHSDSSGNVKEAHQIKVHFNREGRYQYYEGDVSADIEQDTNITDED